MVRPEKSLTASVFINRLKKGENVHHSLSISRNVVLEDLHFTKRVDLFQFFVDGDLIIKNCRFDNGIRMNEVEVDGNFEVINSTIAGHLRRGGKQKGITLSELKVHYEFNIKDLVAPDMIHLMNNRLTALNISESKLEGGLTLYSNTIDDEFTIQNSTIKVLRAEENKIGDSCEIKHLKSNHLHFIDNEISQDFELEQVTVKEKLFIENDRVRCLELDQVQAQHLWLNKVNIHDEFALQTIKAEKIWIDKISVSGEMDISEIITTKEVNLHGGHFGGNVEIFELQVQELNIVGTSNEGLFIIRLDPKEERSTSIEQDQIGLLKIGNGSYGQGMVIFLETFMLPKLHIMNSKSFEGMIGVIGGIMDELLISGLSNDGVLSLQRCLVNVLHIEQATNEGSLIISEIKPVKANSRLTIEKSVLGSARFINMDISQFAIIEIYNSFLEDIKYSNVLWFHPNSLNRNYYDKHAEELTDEEKEIHLGNKREVYRQLKYAAENQGDRAQALEFKAEEYRIYQELLQCDIDFIKKQRNKNKNKKRGLWQLRGERLSLRIGNFTNRLGQNWLRPLTQISIATVIAYPFFVIAASDKLTWWPVGNQLALVEAFNLFWQKLGVLPQLFNPARYINRVFGNEELPGIVYFWDTFHRLLLAFYIYQIITAFRKYFK